MLPLPRPVTGGSIQDLRKFVNTSSDDDWILLQAWLVAALQPEGPYPILTVNGEQGSGKSTTCRMLRTLVDPNSAPVRSLPKAEHDLVITASNSLCLVFDNVSSIPIWLSDALCRISTGGGYATRELYSDREEILFNEQRPIILNGIGDLATRGDLLDRSIIISAAEITEEDRTEEKELWEEYEKVLPKIFACLLDAVVSSLQRRPEVQLSRKPRMADFARTVVAAEPALDVKPGAFLPAYFRNCGAAHETAIEISSVGQAILALLQDRDSWKGTPSALLDALEESMDEKARRRRDWPKAPNALSNILKRLSPNLRKAHGIEISFGRSAGKRTLLLDKPRKRSSSSSPSSPLSEHVAPESVKKPTPSTHSDDRDGPVTIGDDHGDDPQPESRHSRDDHDDQVTIPSYPKSLPINSHDDGDDDDDLFRAESNDAREEVEI